MKDIIAKYCKELRLGRAIVENYQDIEATTNEEFLVKLLELAVQNRHLTRKNRYLKQANFEVMKTFENYSFDNIHIPESITLNELKEGRFIHRRENLILYGPVGTGKTHMATAIGVNACNQEKRVKFYRTATLVNQLVQEKEKGRLNKFLETLRKADLLICDECGYIPLDREGAQLLFQVIAERYERRSVIITTNLEFINGTEYFMMTKLLEP
jgi:DNA replication protein DnaC